ncbi:pol polyprotein [Fusarium flagelliforme]|uniref:Pol polyprotein n=1 Tax=Fusarium flagelliforme TaxID=2675880 RepID=A0A395M670_9HYPO|nr:pol polyprotein [Fusarium flagelliforme]
MDDPSDTEDDSETEDKQRSQTSTKAASEVRRKKHSHPPPKGTQQKHEKGKIRHVRRIVTTFGAQLHDLDAKLEQQKTPLTEDRLKNVPQEYRCYKKLFKEELDTKKIYNLNELELTTLRDYLEEELRKGNIRESTSSAGFPVIQLNDLTVKDRTPLPLITELKDRLQGKQIFTALNLKGAYNLICIKKGNEWKTTFRTKFGLFEYLVMPFGLTNAPATFQRMINNVLRQYLDVFVVCYLDDILIFLDNEEEHREHIHKVLKALQDANLLVELEKSYFHVKEVDFLGHTILPGEIQID